MPAALALIIEVDPVRLRRRREREQVVAQLRRQIPGEDHAVLGPRLFGGGGDDDLARQGLLPLLHPQLPVDVLLAEGVVVASGPVDGRSADQGGGRDLGRLVLIAPPVEEISQREVDAPLGCEFVMECPWL